jgi:cinnamoyl-CoA:phenyllactate CoA-transferase
MGNINNTRSDSNKNILDGIKVIELSTFIAVPACARFFADYGATVIKIEAKDGDPARWNGISEGRVDNPYENTTFDLENANKKGIVLNLKSPEGKEILIKLLEGADAFLTNWRPQALEKNGLSYEELHKKYPKLVYGMLTGYGEKGPDKHLPGFDFTAYWARGGIMESLRQKGQWPFNLIPGLGDHQASLSLAVGVMAALFHAQRTGVGEKVSTNLLHNAIFIQAVMIQAAQYTELGQKYPIDRHTADNPFNCAYKTKDGRFLQISMPQFDMHYPKFMPLIGREDLAHEPRYTMENISKNKLHAEFIGILNEAFEKKTLDEWAEIFTANEISFSAAQSWEEVLEDRQAWANDVFFQMHYPTGNTRALVRQPIFIGDEPTDYKMAPLLGEHSEEIIRELGYTDDELKDLHAAGVYYTWDDLKKLHNCS